MVIAGLVDVAGCPISTPPDDLCLYHCISFARDPELYASIPRSDLGHFIGDGAAAMTRRARSIRDELVALLRAIGMILAPCAISGWHPVASVLFCSTTHAVVLQNKTLVPARRLEFGAQCQ